MNWSSFFDKLNIPQASQEVIENRTNTGFSATFLSAIHVTGPDAAKFLQGQVTCDINQLTHTPTESMLGAHCTHKGRALFVFRAVALDAESILLIIPSSMEDIALAALKKYAVFSKVALSISDYRWLMVATPLGALPLIHHPGTNKVAINSLQITIGLDEHVSLVGQPNWESLESCWQTLSESSAAQPPSFTDYWFIELGLAHIVPATHELYVPQMLNLQATAQGISFKKGCYTGQEVVARMAYLGKLKKRTYKIEIASTGTLAAQAALFDEQGKKVGHTLTAAPDYTRENYWLALAVIDNNRVDHALFADEECHQIVNLAALPYAIPKGINE